MAKQGGIPLDWLVNITSAGVRDAFSISKLPTLLITKDQALPNTQWGKHYDSQSVKKAFGYDSLPALFADNYFGFSSKKASKADMLNILIWNERNTPAIIKGGMPSDIAELSKLRGGFSLTAQGETKNIEVDFTGAVSYGDIASIMQDKIREAGSGELLTLQVTKAESTELEITANNPSGQTQTLTINTGDTNDYKFEIEPAQGVISYDKANATITALGAGSATLTIKAQGVGKGAVMRKVEVAVQQASGGALSLNSVVGDLKVLNAHFSVATNAQDYTFTCEPADTIAYVKETGILNGLKAGNATFTITANAFSQTISKSFEATIAQDLSIESIQEPASGKKKQGDRPIVNPAFALADVSFNAHTKGFILKCGVKGVESQISFLEPALQGVDISGELGLTEQGGASKLQGYNGISSFGELLSLIDSTNGAYYAIAFDFELNADEMLAFAKFVDSSNDRYLGIIHSQNRNISLQDSTLEAYKGYNGVLFDYAPNNSILGFSAGIISALDFSQTGGNVNIAFNDATKFESVAITTKAELEALNTNNANSILKFAQIGQSQTWYGMGNIQGTKTNSANIYIANSYLKFQLQFACANMFDSQGMVGLRGTSNETMIMSYLESVFIGAVKAGIIIEGAELTTTEKQSLLSSFGTAGETAIQQCSRQGYYYKIDRADLVNQTLGIVVAYVSNKPANRIIINNYILGA